MTPILYALLLVAADVDVSAVTSVRDSYPHLSPDGRTLLFHSNRSGKQAIWAADADGGHPRLLFDGGTLGIEPGTPVWSPDGGTIAFGMRPAGATGDDESDVYVMRPDGSGIRRLTDAPGDDSHPHWSADGRRIFFNSARATPDLAAPWNRQWIDIYSMAADGGDIRRHTQCRAVCTYPVPSPDGRSVAHRRALDTPGRNWDQSETARNSEVFVTDLATGKGVNVSASPAYDGWPMWAPHGRFLVFASNRESEAMTGQIWAVRPDGSGLRRLTSGRWSRVQPSFSADGTRLFVYQGVEDADAEIGHVASFAIPPE